ncbi:MAG TPA: carboxypeptidase-like regulatory domain-containing protein [Pirellulaceae bacterium]|nr:carboxypeptidase-like regulatory domain-containing protein [Pirellulaceae bacterium]
MARFFWPQLMLLIMLWGAPTVVLQGQDSQFPIEFGGVLQDDPPPTGGLDSLIIPPQTEGLQSQFDDLPQIPQVLEQSVVVRARLAGWNQASLEPNVSPAGSPLRGHWVLISDFGELVGTVTGPQELDVRNLQVYLLLNGRQIKSTRTNEFGSFQFDNVSAGTYSLVGFGDQAMFAYAFNAIEYKESLVGKMPESIRVRAVENVTTINMDWIRYFSPKVEYRVYGRFEAGEGTNDPPNLLGLEGLSLIPPAALPATTIADHSVALTPDNRLVGRVHQVDGMNGRPVDVRNMRAMLLQNNDVVAAATVNNYGVFTFYDVPPGDYALVVAGSDGLGCIGINVVEDLFADEHTGPIDITLTTSETVGWLNNLASEAHYQRIVRRSQGGQTTDCPCECNGPCGCGAGDGNMNRSRSRPFQRAFRFMNDMFDEIFYGESNPHNSQQYNDGRYRPRPF